jgi:O-antigen/teichoic acid export membrane protein
MKRPERESDLTPSVPAPLASGQRRWGARIPRAQDAVYQEASEEQDELVSANPLEWWADAETNDDPRFATGSMISIDATATGPQMIPESLQGLTPPARRRIAQSSAWPLQGREAPPAAGRPIGGPNQPALGQRAPAGSATVGTEEPQVQQSSAAPLERDDTAYIPAWRVSTARMPAIVARAETMVAIVKRLMRSSGLYAVAALGTPAVSLALTPFLAHNMTESDYGLLAVLNTSISLFAGLTQLGLGPAFFRAYNYDFTSEKERRSVLATSLLLMSMLSAAFLTITLPLAPVLAGLLSPEGGSVVVNEVMIACVVIACQNLSVPGFAWLRAEDRALAFSLVSMANVLMTLGASIVLVGALRGGVAGAMIANGAGYATVVVGTFIPMLARSRLRFSAKVARSMLAFGAPLTLSVISVWVLQLSDRYLLAFFGDFSETASYAVAYSLGSVVSTIVLAPFSLAWPTAMYSIAKRADAPRVFQQVFRWFTAVLLFAAFGLSLASTVLLTILFPPSYRAAAPVIPVVAASIALYGVYTVIMVGANVRRKTWMTSVFTASAAVVNVALNLILIPRFGSIGAAASTFFAYLALVVIAFIANQRIYPVPYEVMRAVFAGLMGIALYYLIAQLPAVLHDQVVALGPSVGAILSDNYVALALAVVGLLIYGAWLYMLLQIRTIDFHVNPAIMRRLARHVPSRAMRRGHSEEAYARR